MSSQRQYVAARAQELRDSDRLQEALAFLEAEADAAHSEGDPECEAEALAWLSTTHWLLGQKTEGLEAARAATVAAERVSESRAIDAWLRLAALLTDAGEAPDPEAQEILSALEERTARHPDSRFEDLRLQRLESYYRRSDSPGEREAVREALSRLHVSGAGFREDAQS